jgi:hypothetical protein
VDSLLKETLPTSLDRDSFSISSKKLTESEISGTDLFVDQVAIKGQTSYQNHTASTLRSIAIVDRSANIQQAANDIVRARMPPNNCSPYSPDLIIINDFMCEEFEKACVECAGAERTEKGTPGSQIAASNNDNILREALQKAERAGQVSIQRLPASNLSIVNIKDRYLTRYKQKESHR